MSVVQTKQGSAVYAQSFSVFYVFSLGVGWLPVLSSPLGLSTPTLIFHSSGSFYPEQFCVFFGANQLFQFSTTITCTDNLSGSSTDIATWYTLEPVNASSYSPQLHVYRGCDISPYVPGEYSTLYCFGGISNFGINSNILESFSILNGWSLLYDGTSYGPSPRFLHTLTYLSDTRTLMMSQGSSPVGQPQGDIWIFDLTTHAWSLVDVLPDLDAPLGFYQNTPPVPVQPYRVAQTTERIARYHIIYGGGGINATTAGDVWVFDEAEFTFQQFNSSNTPGIWPLPRSFHQSVEFHGTIIIAGGRTNRQSPSAVTDTWQLTFTPPTSLLPMQIAWSNLTDRCAQLHPAAPWILPLGSIAAGFSVVNDAPFWFAGLYYSAGTATSDANVYRLNVTTGCWSVVPYTTDSTSSSLEIVGRTEHCMVSYLDSFIVYGGQKPQHLSKHQT